MKTKSGLLKATKTMIEASSAFKVNQIEVKANVMENGAVGRLIVYSKGKEDFLSTEIVGYANDPLSSYVTYNHEEGRCELVIF